MLVIAITILGLLLGSFINAAVWRIHTKKDLVKGRSQCPKCGHQLAAKDLVPVVSWLWLRGRCRYCHQAISWQYPLVELLTALVFALSYLAWNFSAAYSYPSLGVWLLMVVGLVILAVYDLRWLILPNKVMLALVILAASHLLARLALTASFGPVGAHLLAAALASGFFYLLYLVGKGRWMGGGDVKLAFLMGLILGGAKTLVAMFVGFNLAAIVSLVLIAATKLTRKDVIPFGPFLIAGTIAAMLFGQQVLDAYVNYFLIH